MMILREREEQVVRGRDKEIEMSKTEKAARKQVLRSIALDAETFEPGGINEIKLSQADGIIRLSYYSGDSFAFSAEWRGATWAELAACIEDNPEGVFDEEKGE